MDISSSAFNSMWLQQRWKQFRWNDVRICFKKVLWKHVKNSNDWKSINQRPDVAC